MTADLLVMLKGMRRCVHARDLSVSQLAIASLMYLQIAQPFGNHDSAEAYYREWHLAHHEMGRDAPLPTHDDDKAMNLPPGVLEAGMKRLIHRGDAFRSDDGSVFIPVVPVVHH